MVSCGPIGIRSSCRQWYRMGPLAYAAVAADIIVWAHRNVQLLLPTVSHGPISISSYCCRWLRMGPLISQQVLPIASFGPIGICSCCCRWFRVGPSAYAAAAAAADGIAWAHWHMQPLLPMASHGPISLPTGAADSFVWAHWNMQLLLPMVSRGPIGVCSCGCRWYRVGPSAYAVAAVDVFAWAH